MLPQSESSMVLTTYVIGAIFKNIFVEGNVAEKEHSPFLGKSNCAVYRKYPISPTKSDDSPSGGRKSRARLFATTARR